MSARPATLLVLALACLRSVTAQAQGARTDGAELALDEVTAAAERAYPLLKAAEQERAIAAADLLAAEGGFDATWKTRATVIPVGYYDSVRIDSAFERPTSLWGITPFVGYKLGSGRFAVYDGRLETLEYGEARVGVNAPIWRNGPIDRRRATLARAEIGTEVARLSVAEQRIQVRRAAAQRYWAWVAAGRKVDVAERLLRNVERRDEAVAARVERGDLPAIERTDNARAVEQRRAQLSQAERGLEQAAIELSLFFRDAEGRATPPPRARLPRSLPEPGPTTARAGADDLSVAMATRPEARRIALQLRQNSIEMRWGRNQLAPGLDLQLVGSQDFGADNPRRPDLSKPIFEISLLLDVPIQTRAIRGKLDAATALASRLQYQATFAKDRVEADVRDAQSAILRAAERVEAARREVRLAEELEEAERTRYAQGDSQLLIVNLREQQTAEAELRAIDARLDHQRAIADLRAARGE